MAKLKEIAELYKECSFPMRDKAIAASDNCGQPAISAVEMENGNRMWRCVFHGGIRNRKGDRGNILYQLWVD